MPQKMRWIRRVDYYT